MATRHRRLAFGVLSAVTVACLGTGVAWTLSTRPEARAMASRERKALDAVRSLARAEEAVRASGRIDRDKDGTAEYGSLDDLEKAGLSPLRVLRDAAGPYAEESGYRVEVLLPRGTERSGSATLGRDGRGVDAALSALLFVVVAMPREDVPSGLRAFYMDAARRIWVAEGVCAGSRDPYRPPPTSSLVEKEEFPREGGPAWRFRDGPPLTPTKDKKKG